MAGDAPQATKPPQEGHMLTSFATNYTKPQAPVSGGLVTIVDYAKRQLAARLTRIDTASGDAWVTIIGWPIHPYSVGDKLTVNISQVIDWE